MEVLTLLEAIKDMMDRSATLPFSKKTLINKDEVLDVVKEIEEKLPDELKQAKWVKEERQKILLDAQKEANDLIKEAENRIISMIDEHEITKKAYEQKAEIIDSANAFSKDLIAGTKEYADGILADLENSLKEKLEVVKNNRKELK
ncbi:MAG: ATPase [Clostridia bacterium]|nr:ATPase [Clostridia bacterium]